MSPRVSFVMGVFNGAGMVSAAMASVLSQTFGDFEFIVVDDGSSDGTAEVLRGMADARVRLLRNEGNLGLSASLNRGIEAARGEFVARMDADDVSLPQRTAAQVAWLEGHSDVDVVGSWIETFSEEGAAEVVKYPTEAGAVGAALLFRSALAHPAVMFRRQRFVEVGLRYEPAFRYAQDYALWLNGIAKGLRFCNLSEVLLRYRVHAGQLSAAMEKMQGEGTEIRSRFLRWFVAGVTERELGLHEGISRDRLVAESGWLEDAVGWLEKLARVNESRRTFDRDGLLRALTGRYVAVVRYGRQHQIAVPESPLLQPYLREGAL